MTLTFTMLERLRRGLPSWWDFKADRLGSKPRKRPGVLHRVPLHHHRTYHCSAQLFSQIPKSNQSSAVSNWYLCQWCEKTSQETRLNISDDLTGAAHVNCLLEVLTIIHVGLKSLSVSCSDMYISYGIPDELCTFDQAGECCSDSETGCDLWKGEVLSLPRAVDQGDGMGASHGIIVLSSLIFFKLTWKLNFTHTRDTVTWIIYVGAEGGREVRKEQEEAC